MDTKIILAILACSLIANLILSLRKSKKGIIKKDIDLLMKEGQWFIITNAADSVPELSSDNTAFRLYCLQQIDNQGKRVGEKTWYELNTNFVFVNNLPPKKKTIYEVRLIGASVGGPDVKLKERENKILF